MSAPLFFVEDLSGPSSELSEEDSRHALRSLRLRGGEAVTLADGRGTVARGRLAERRGGRAVVEIDERERLGRPEPALTVLLSPPKGDRLALAVQKLAEIGADRLVLVRSERSIRAWDEGRTGRVLDRLRGVAREAAMQARRPFVMEVAGAGTLPSAVREAAGPVVVLWEGATAPLSAALPARPGSIGLVVGPEGGLADGEAEELAGAGAVLATLGAGILRTETAAIVGAALVLARYGRLG